MKDGDEQALGSYGLRGLRLAIAGAASAALVLAGPAFSQATDPNAIPDGWTAQGMEPVGYVDLDAIRTFKLGLKQVGERWFLFVGEGGSSIQERTGFRVVDVTDPANPVSVVHIPVPVGDGQITLNGNLLIAGMQLPFPPPEAGGSIEYPYNNAPAEPTALASFFDISDPTQPRKLTDWVTPGWATHRNSYPGGKYAYMAAWVPGYRGQSILVTLDVSDPSNPREVSRWWMPGQREDETEVPPPSGYHGAPILSADGKMLTLGYTPSVVNLDISDPANPKLIGRLDFSPLAALGTQAIHSVVPLSGTLLHVSTEPSRQGCGRESLPFAAIVDNADPAKPYLLAYYPRPVPEPETGLKSFCDKEGRFGPHNVVTELHQDAVKQTAPLVFMTYFNAGLRVYDTRDPFMPKEVGWFLPKIGPWSEGQRGPEDVIADTRGNIFASDGRAGGIWVLRYTGPQPGPRVQRPAPAALTAPTPAAGGPTAR